MQEAAADAADTAAITLSTYGTYRRKGGFDTKGRFTASAAAVGVKPLRQHHRASSEQYTSSIGTEDCVKPFFNTQFGSNNQFCNSTRRNRLVFLSY